MSASIELPGLSVHLDKLVHRQGPELPPERPHGFIYFLTIRNESSVAITLLGRKWVIDHADGTQLVIEGDKIVGETPHLEPGEQFSYNSFHVTSQSGNARGSFHGVDENGRKIFVRIPEFDMRIPDSGN